MYRFPICLVSISAAMAALIPPMPAITVPAMLPRQASDNGNYTVGYVALRTNGGTDWSASEWDASASYLYTYDTFYQQCSLSTVFETDGTTTTSLLETDRGCPVWTDCSHTTVYNAGGSSTCGGLYGLCYSDIKYSSLGASKPLTRIYCDWTGRHKEMSTTVYEATTTAEPSSSATSDTSPGHSQSSQTSASPSNTASAVPTATSAPESNPSSPSSSGKDNTGVIAGSVVGGLAVFAFAGVAILYILKRSKRHQIAAPTYHNGGTPGVQQYQAELDSPGIVEAAPSYYEGSATKYGSRVITRGELDGQQSRVEMG